MNDWTPTQAEAAEMDREALSAMRALVIVMAANAITVLAVCAGIVIAL